MEENVENEIKLLLGGVIPERSQEMTEYLDKYTPYFARCDDRDGFLTEAGAYGILKFTQRTMNIMWIIGFAANQALNSYSSILALLRLNGKAIDLKEIRNIPGQKAEIDKYKELIQSAYTLSKVEKVELFKWPKGVPFPEKGKPNDIEGATTFDLICMSGAYVFLHEMKHIAFYEDGNAPSEPHEEEIQCDLFAQSMMLDNLEKYAEQSGYELRRLVSKRAMAISLALFYMLVITPLESWAGFETHPSISTRIRTMINNLSINDDDIFWLYISPVFLAHLEFLGEEDVVIEFNNLKDLAMALVELIERKCI